MKLRAGLLVLAALITAPIHPGSAPAEPAVDASAAAAGRSREELEQELDEFIPSEGVPADSAISFPVDI